LPANFADEARFLLAVKLFEQGRISSGKAGRLCDMGRIFLLLNDKLQEIARTLGKLGETPLPGHSLDVSGLPAVRQRSIPPERYQTLS
jgi:hypothetical protein